MLTFYRTLRDDYYPLLKGYCIEKFLNLSDLINLQYTYNVNNLYAT